MGKNWVSQWKLPNYVKYKMWRNRKIVTLAPRVKYPDFCKIEHTAAEL